MIIFKKMFAEKILRFHEGTNKCLRLLKRMPFIGTHISGQIFDRKNAGLRTAVGIVGQIGTLLLEFVRKLVYVCVFMYLPYLFISAFCPVIKSHQELTMIYLFFILSTVCGSLANNIMLAMGDRDYLMIRVMLISPYMNFLGKLTYKLVTDFIYFTIILCIFKVSFINSILLSFVTLCARPIGEMLVIIIHDKIKSLYNNRNTYNGCIMALSVLLAYGLPLLERKIHPDWMAVVHPAFAVIMLLAGAGAMYFLWWYKYYRNIMREAMYIKRED